MTYLDALEPEERIVEIRRLFREVFTTPGGKIVFTTLLQELCFFDHPTTEREEALRSFANYLIGMTCAQDQYALTEALLRVKED